jgi:zinc finger protein
LDAFLNELKRLCTGEVPFTFILDDPAGNSFIENPRAPNEDPNMSMTVYKRTPEQNWAIGLTTDASAEELAQEKSKIILP